MVEGDRLDLSPRARSATPSSSGASATPTTRWTPPSSASRGAGCACRAAVGQAVPQPTRERDEPARRPPHAADRPDGGGAGAAALIEALQRGRGDARRRAGVRASRSPSRSAAPGPLDLIDYALLRNPLLRPFNRVIVMVTFNVDAAGADGRDHHPPGARAGHGAGHVDADDQGEDVSVMMDRRERSPSIRRRTRRSSRSS